ncbi:MAG: dipeptide epimerase [Planctomycetota bacterium]
MKLATHIEHLQLRHTFTIARSSEDVTRVVIGELEHDGIVGIGEASPSDFYDETCESVIDALSGVDLSGLNPQNYHHLLEEAGRELGSTRAALSVLDLAVHDWACRAIGKPLHRVLGLDPARIPVSSFTVGISELDHMVEKLQEASNYPVIKIKLGTPNDLEIVRALREHSSAVFRVDANCAWSADECIEKSRVLKDLGVEFIEQPLPPDRLDEMEKVFRESSLPIIADESSMTPDDVPELRERFHGINIKLVKCGGIAPALRMVHLARSFGMRVMFGCMIESSVAIGAACEIGALADYLDLDGNVLITNDPYLGVENRNGKLVLPEKGFVERR